MNFLLRIFYIILLFFFNADCEMNPLLPKKKKSNIHKVKEFVNDYGSFGCFIYVDQIKYNTVEDNNDGTLSLVQYSGTSSPLCIFNLGSKPNLTRSVQYYVKKCVQGQVYRHTQNDCQGTGNAANYYNAQKYQRCITNDTNCDQLDANGYYLIDYTKSPAGVSCRTDITANKSSWFIFPITFLGEYSNYINYFSDAPQGSSDYYWIANIAGAVTQAGTYKLEAYNWKLQSVRFSLTTNNYVLCGLGGL